MNTTGTFPSTRMRRSRSHAFTRALRSETHLSTDHLIWPLFIHDKNNASEVIPSMPGVLRYNQQDALKAIKEAHSLGIRSVALFPVISDNLKSDRAEQAWDDSGLIPQLIKKIKDQVPSMGIITDVALDPYTTHGQDGLVGPTGEILNDETIEALVKQALCHAKVGADIVAPSDMMDGRIGAIRNAFEKHKYSNTMILAYSAKYASHFYGPFRDAVGSKKALGKSNKQTYQMDPANSDEALTEIVLDIKEGADFIMVKPGLPYLDIIQRARQSFQTPVFAYNVSGEYAMVKAAASQGWLDEKNTVLEILTSFRRAGAHGILTYHALDAAKWLS